MLELRSQRELRLMRRAGLVVWAAHQAVRQVVRPGVTTQEIDAEVERVFERFGATPLFRGVGGPKSPFPAVSCVSVNEQVVHGIPGPRVLEEGDIVSVDTGCKLQGWCGDSAWTYPVGAIRPEVQKLLEVTEQTLELAISLLPRERSWAPIAKQMQQWVEKHGFSVVETFVGHGIGRSMHEPPQLPNFDSRQLRKQDVELLAGMTMAIEPMVTMGTKEVKCLGDQWTQAAVDGLPSAHFEHTVALTDEGPWLLTGSPQTAEEQEFLAAGGGG